MLVSFQPQNSYRFVVTNRACAKSALAIFRKPRHKMGRTPGETKRSIKVSGRVKKISTEKSKIPDLEDLFLKEKGIEDFQEDLLHWYHVSRRKLPWRGDIPPYSVNKTPTSDRHVVVNPYATWVSEIMLQQTRVETVIDYFNNWMKKFPDVASLARATPDEVNAAWAGLGYYSRARNLHKGAKMVVKDFNGRVPSSQNELLSIPGIGRYTSGAIGSIAFKNPVPLVDGNVIRVFSRLCRVSLEAKDPALIKACWNFAEKLVTVEGLDPGSFNQALMELGATVCTPKSPKCEDCPVQSFCIAYKEEGYEDPVVNYPKKASKKKVPEEIYAVSVISRIIESKNDEEAQKEYLVVKRPEKGLLSGQLQFIACKLKSLTSEQVLELEQTRNLRNSKMKLNLSLKEFSFDYRMNESNKYMASIGMCEKCIACVYSRKDVGSFIHTFSHLKHHLLVTAARYASPECESCKYDTNVQWLRATELNAKGLTKSMKECLRLGEKGDMVKNVLDGNLKSKKRKRKKTLPGQTLLTVAFSKQKC